MTKEQNKLQKGNGSKYQLQLTASAESKLHIYYETCISIIPNTFLYTIIKLEEMGE